MLQPEGLHPIHSLLQKQQNPNLVIKNNLTPPTNTLKKTNLIYQFSFHEGDCELHNQTYIPIEN